MDQHNLPPSGEQLPRQSWWQKRRASLILWGILAPPRDEADHSEEEQRERNRYFFQFRRRSGR